MLVNPHPPECGQRSQRGETLVSLLVGLTLGLLALAAGTHMLAQLLSGQRLARQDTHLQQDLHAALDLLAMELQDAQYSAASWARRSPSQCDDDFCDSPQDFSLGSQQLDWTLDRNHNAVQDNNECAGYRLRAGALQMRTACTPPVWVPLTDTATLQLARLETRVHCTPRSGWVQRQVQLDVEAYLPQNPERRITLQRLVLLRNALPQVVQARYCP